MKRHRKNTDGSQLGDSLLMAETLYALAGHAVRRLPEGEEKANLLDLEKSLRVEIDAHYHQFNARNRRYGRPPSEPDLDRLVAEEPVVQAIVRARERVS